MVFIMNKSMCNLFKMPLDKEELSCLAAPLISEVFTPKLINIHGCIIINNADEDISLTDEQFAKVVKMHTDRTGYEASCNDIGLNYYFSEKTSIRAMLETSHAIATCWQQTIMNFDPQKQHCIIIGCIDESITMRFHSIWPDEPLWIHDDIENYSEAVAYVIF